GRSLARDEMIAMLDDWTKRFPIGSIEDPLDEDDEDGWTAITNALGARVRIIGDDFFTTNPARLREGVESRWANAALIKMNQIGTLTETFEALGIVRDAGWQAVVSARSGETEDNFLADLA